MTSGTPWKHILRFSLPVLAGSLLQQLYNTVDDSAATLYFLLISSVINVVLDLLFVASFGWGVAAMLDAQE